MSFTDIGNVGTGSGKIYDSNEAKRLSDFANSFEELAQSEDANNYDVKRQNIIRYSIIIGGSILLLVGLKLLVKIK